MKHVVSIVVVLGLALVDAQSSFACNIQPTELSESAAFLQVREKPNGATPPGVACLTSDAVVVGLPITDDRIANITAWRNNPELRKPVETALYEKAEELCGIYGKRPILVGERPPRFIVFYMQRLFACVPEVG